MYLERDYYHTNPLYDTKYVGFLSYRHIRILGWIFIILAQVASVLATRYLVLSTGAPETNFESLLIAQEYFEFYGSLSTPLFILANFAIILQRRKETKSLVRNNFIIFAIIYLLFILIYDRYIIGVCTGLDPTKKKEIDTLFTMLLSNFLSFNVFVDLFIFSILYLFMFYVPQNYFKGKKILIFRSFALVPILIEVACFVTKGLSIGMGYFQIPIELLPLYPSKSLITFLAFLTILVCLKIRNHILYKKGCDDNDIDAYFSTNKHSLRLSIVICVSFIVAGILDSVLYGISLNSLYQIDGMDIKQINTMLNAWGIGSNASLLMAAPLVFLFDYKKKHSISSKWFDLLLPVFGIILCVITHLEGIYQLVKALSVI